MRVVERKVIDPDEIQRILIRGVNWVGDAVMTTPAIAGIRKTFPRAKISLLVKPWVAGVFEGSPDIDEILIYDASIKKKTAHFVPSFHHCCPAESCLRRRCT